MKMVDGVFVGLLMAIIAVSIFVLGGYATCGALIDRLTISGHGEAISVVKTFWVCQ